LGRLFQKLSEKVSGVKARNTDQLILEDIMSILGDGDLEAGRAHYQAACQEQLRKVSAKSDYGQNAPGTWVHGSYFECLTDWSERLLELSVRFPEGSTAIQKRKQVRWMTEVVYILEENIPLPQLLRYLGEENVLYLVQVNGFRSQDEDGDLAYISNTWGKPVDDFEEANGIFQFYARKTGVVPSEIDRTQGSFR
jgi:hypothetical protein